MSGRTDLSARIMEALNLAHPSTYADIHAHTSWHVTQMLTELQPSDLTSPETMAIAVILSIAHARKLAKPRSPLTIVPIGPSRENVAS